VWILYGVLFRIELYKNKKYKNPPKPLHSSYKLPAHVFADFLPDFVLHIEFLTGFEKRKAGKKLIQLEKLAELIQYVGI
jgi:hypothetical protein